MALQETMPVDQLEAAVDTALGRFSCSMNPLHMACQVLKAARYLEEATIVAGLCDQICNDMWETIINQLPVLCELFCLGQLLPDSKGVPDLQQALLQCMKSVCNALHAALTAMYKYLRCNKLSQLMHAASVKGELGEKCTQVQQSFEDVRAHTQLACLLRSQLSAQQAQHTAAKVQEVQQQLLRLERTASADKSQVQARAKAALAEQAPEGHKVKVGKGAARTVAVSPSGGSFATGAQDGTVAVWATATGTCMHELQAHTRCVNSVAWSPDGVMLATGADDSSAAVWDAATGSLMHELLGASRGVNSVAWRPHGSQVAVGSDNRNTAVWNGVTGKRMHELCGHRGWVLSVAWSPDGSRVATGSADSSAAVWDAAAGTRMYEMHGHSNWVKSVAWSPDGSQVAVGSADSTLTVRNAEDGACMHKLRGHSKGVTSVAWSPDGARVATGSEDGTAAVWEVATWSRMRELHGHSSGVTSVAWSPDGCFVYSSSRDGSVRIYNVAARCG